MELLVVVGLFLDAPSRLRENEINDLGDGLWELKVGTARLPFVAGTCTGTRSSNGDGRRLVLPDRVAAASEAGRCARFTHGFEKRSQKTPVGEIDRTRAIAREDKLT